MPKRWRNRAGSDAQCAGGNVAILFALVLPMLIAGIAGAVDFAVWLRARSIVRTSIDAALLRGARELQINRSNPDAAVQAAERSYRASSVQRLTLGNDTIRFEVVDGGSGISARGGVAVVTPFAGHMGLPPLPLLATSGAEDAKGVVTIGQNARQNLEIAIVVDVSRAMSGGLMDMLKGPLDAFIDEVVWPTAGGYRARAAIVPYADGVAPGALLTTVTDAVPARVYFDLAAGTRMRLLATDCVAERQGPQAASDAAPEGGDVIARLYSASGRCGATSPITPLTSDTSLLKAGIDGLTAGAGNGAAGHVGAAWGWYLLSPNWSAVLGAAAEPASYAGLSRPPGDAASLRKIVVLIGAAAFDTQTCNTSAAPAVAFAAMPDRNSPVSATSAGACLSPRGASDTQADALCAAMRASGLWIFALSLAAPSAPPLQRCVASADSFYEASGTVGIQLALQDIALKITKTYLSR